MQRGILILICASPDGVFILIFEISRGLYNVPLSLSKVQYDSLCYNQYHWELILVLGMQVPALVYACSFLASIVLQVYLCTTFVILYTLCMSLRSADVCECQYALIKVRHNTNHH